MGYITKIYRVSYIAKNFRTGLTNIVGAVFRPDNVVLGTYPLQEMPGVFKGVYYFDFATAKTDPEGEYYVIIVSPSEFFIDSNNQLQIYRDVRRISLYNLPSNTSVSPCSPDYPPYPPTPPCPPGPSESRMIVSRNVGANTNLTGNNMGISNAQFPQLDHQTVIDVIDQFSVAIKYWKAIQCPCSTGRTGQPNISCHECRGLGWYYTAFEMGKIYERAQVHSRNSSRQNDKGGDIIQGHNSITFFPGVVPGEGDLVQICKDREIVNDEYHVVGAVLTDGSSAETLRFRDVVCVEYVVVQDKTTKLITVASPNTYVFDRTQRRVIFDPELPLGTNYSVRYLAVPEYIIRAETARPLLRVAHDDNLNDPARTKQDIVYPYNVMAVRLDRAVLQRQRGAIDLTVQSTFNNSQGRGPWL